MSSNTKSLEPTHLKFIARLDSLVDLGTYVREVLKLFNLYSPNGMKKIKQKKKAPKKASVPQPAKFAEFWGLKASAPPSGYESTDSLVKKLENVLCRIHSLQERYFDIASPILSGYYDSHSEARIDTNEFYHLLTSDNLIDKIEQVRSKLHLVVSELESCSNFVEFLVLKDKLNNLILSSCQRSSNIWTDESLFQGISDQLFAKISFKETVQKLKSIYDENKPELPGLAIKNNNICPQCKENFVLFPDDSENRCEKCGFVDVLPGTLFEDSQFYNQQITCAKHKKHSFAVHGMKWLYQIQAKENKTVSQATIDILNKRAIKEYTRSGVKRNMAGMKCRQVREWLKATGFPKLNNHAPLIRKIITGLNGEPVSPPQLLDEEEQLLLGDFNMAIAAFDELSKDEEILRIFNKCKISNKVYYPFFWLKILMHRFKRDPRLYGLIECIHLQSASTLTKDDLLWQKMCPRMNKYVYEPTDRTMLIDIF